MIDRDEFVENESYCVITGKDEFGVQHIALWSDLSPLCGARIKKPNTSDLFAHAYLCGKCSERYEKSE